MDFNIEILEKLTETKNEFMAEFTKASEQAEYYSQLNHFTASQYYIGLASAYVDAIRKLDLLILMSSHEAK